MIPHHTRTTCNLIVIYNLKSPQHAERAFSCFTRLACPAFGPSAPKKNFILKTALRAAILRIAKMKSPAFSKRPIPYIINLPKWRSLMHTLHNVTSNMTPQVLQTWRDLERRIAALRALKREERSTSLRSANQCCALDQTNA